MGNFGGKRSFVVYETFVESIDRLPEEMRPRLYSILLHYGLYEELPNDMTPVEQAVFTSIQFGIDEAKSRRKVNQENGSKAGNRIGNQNARKDKKCTDCKFYRKCEKQISAEFCSDYTIKNDKNENERKPAETSENEPFNNENYAIFDDENENERKRATKTNDKNENELNVNVNVNEDVNENEFKALVLNEPRFTDSLESDDFPKPKIDEYKYFDVSEEKKSLYELSEEDLPF